MTRFRTALALVALLAAGLALTMLERGRLGLEVQHFEAGGTPASLTAQPGATGPLVLIAHGFAGARQMMHSYALSLAHAGYRAVTFDFAGHGRNPQPLSGDVTRIEGTTRLLVAESARVLDAARRLTGAEGPAAVIGHSMASDIVVRLAAERRDIAAVIGISMYSEAVTPSFPERLLILTGAGEPTLRANALAAVRMIDPAGEEGDLVARGAVTRLALVAPGVEHVGVLHSETAVRAARGWLDAAFQRESAAPPVLPGRWAALLLLAILAGAWALSPLIGPKRPARDPLPALRVIAISLTGAGAGILAGAALPFQLPGAAALGTVTLVLGANGAVQLFLLSRAGPLTGGVSHRGLGFVLIAGLLFALALDRYGASFWPHGPRVALTGWLLLGAVPMMLADFAMFAGRAAPLWLRIVARIPLVLAPSLTALLVPEEVVFLAVSVPLLLLFLLLLHPIARWAGARGGALTGGLGAGVLLAWSLGAAYPLFAG
ncbi:alpha/beta fold hydrolase [Oceanibium sediminis]|uniref:alpha/beta fold hydrolase n=1 Tax=Oceanibium sediminis TaxID=2026339 RepID=UPI000DD481EE|nr:alpha/beta fold hydrolase [Oceanibium sediminis]